MLKKQSVLNQNFRKLLSQRAAIVEKHIIRFIRNNYSGEFWDALLYAVKYCCPNYERAFFLFVSSKYNNVPYRDISNLGVSIELFIISSYIKDDMHDKNDMRSNKPTMHKKYGQNLSVLIAEIFANLSYKAFNLFIKDNSLYGNKDLIEIYYNACNNLNIGQYYTTNRKKEYTIKEVENLAVLRCGSIYSFCVLAPVLTKYNKIDYTLIRIGIAMGVLLQYKNDIEDFVGKSKLMGKTVLQDYLNAQPNLILAFVNRNKMRLKDRTYFNKYYGHGSLPRKADYLHVQKEIFEILMKSDVFISSAYHMEKIYNNIIKEISIHDRYKKWEEIFQFLFK